MAFKSPELEKVARVAEQLIALGLYDSFDLAVVYLAAGHRSAALAVRMLLSPSGRTVENASFSGTMVSATRLRQHVGKFTETLQELDAGGISLTSQVTVQLRKDTTTPLWSVQPDRSGWHATLADTWLNQIKEIVPSRELPEIDGEIAHKPIGPHGLRVSSLSRLCRYFTGDDLQINGSARASVQLPWPIGEIKATAGDHRLDLVVAGFTGLEKGRLEVLVEDDAPEGDRSFAGPELSWEEVPVGAANPGKSFYSTTLPGSSLAVRGVHLLFAGLTEVRVTTHQIERPDTPSAPRAIEEGAPSQIQQVVPAMQGARLHGLRARNYKALADVALDFSASPLTVLIGPNQAGKSTVLDTLALSRDAALGQLSHGLNRRGPVARLCWRGGSSQEIELTATARADDRLLQHSFCITPVGGLSYRVQRESLKLSDEAEHWTEILSVTNGSGTYRGRALRATAETETLLGELRDAAAYPELAVMRAALSSVALYPYFRTGLALSSEAGDARDDAPMRGAVRIESDARLHPLGDNLPAVLHRMRETSIDDWKDFIAAVRLVFPHLAEIRLPPAGSGRIQIGWKDDQFSEALNAEELSDGTLSYLAALAALFQRGESLVAIDEPERNLHPEAIYRLVGVAKMLSERRPIVFATQSDRLLSYLDDVPEAIAIVRRSDRGTEVVRPQRALLEKWLEEFSLSDIRPELETWGEPE